MAHPTARWLSAGACTLLLCAGVLTAELQLRSLHATHDDAAAAVAIGERALDQLQGDNAALSEQIEAARAAAAAREASLASTEGMLPTEDAAP